MTNDIKQQIQNNLANWFMPKRQALSSRFPELKGVILATRRSMRKMNNKLDRRIARYKSNEFFPCILARHQSVLIRTLGNSDIRLQKQKIINLKKAAEQINGLILQPGQIFSFWETVGKPTTKRGFVPGMLLANGKVVEGVGGGLCQMSNFLCWILLHTPIKIIERYHHSRDVFPDSGRILPFGSGATVFYNFVDLKMQNLAPFPIQIKLWLTDKYLKGQILAPQYLNYKYHVSEKHHHILECQGQHFRFNEIWRQETDKGKIIKDEKIFSNFAPVLYEITPEYLERNNYTVSNFTPTIDTRKTLTPQIAIN